MVRMFYTNTTNLVLNFRGGKVARAAMKQKRDF